MAIGAWRVVRRGAWAMCMPLETASAASALKKATSAVKAIGIGRAAVCCHVGVPFGCVKGCERRSPEARGRDEADGLDGLGEEREPVDGFGVRVEDREAGRDHERVAGDQAGEDGRRRDEASCDGLRVRTTARTASRTVATTKPRPAPVPSSK